MSAFGEICKDAKAFALDVVTLPYRVPVESYKYWRTMGDSMDPRGPKPMNPVTAFFTTAGFEASARARTNPGVLSKNDPGGL